MNKYFSRLWVFLELLLLVVLLVQFGRFKSYADESFKEKFFDGGVRVNDGFYVKDNFYCVWVDNRSDYEVLRTEVHEVCHDLVHNDWWHFCFFDVY